MKLRLLHLNYSAPSYRVGHDILYWCCQCCFTANAVGVVDVGDAVVAFYAATDATDGGGSPRYFRGVGGDRVGVGVYLRRGKVTRPLRRRIAHRRYIAASQ